MVILLYFDTTLATSPGGTNHGAGRVAEASPVYRPRHPERTLFYQLFETHFDRYLVEYEDRYEPRYGYLHPVVPRSVSAFLECGRLQNGFARCGVEMQIVAVITDPEIVEAILRSQSRGACRDPFISSGMTPQQLTSGTADSPGREVDTNFSTRVPSIKWRFREFPIGTARNEDYGPKESGDCADLFRIGRSPS